MEKPIEWCRLVNYAYNSGIQIYQYTSEDGSVYNLEILEGINYIHIYTWYQMIMSPTAQRSIFINSKPATPGEVPNWEISFELVNSHDADNNVDIFAQRVNPPDYYQATKQARLNTAIILEESDYEAFGFTITPEQWAEILQNNPAELLDKYMQDWLAYDQFLKGETTVEPTVEPEPAPTPTTTKRRS